jgi:hypothetical protein
MKKMILTALTICLTNNLVSKVEHYTNYRGGNDFAISSQKKMIKQNIQHLLEDATIMNQIENLSQNEITIDRCLSTIPKYAKDIKKHLNALIEAENLKEEMEEKGIRYGLLSEEEYNKLMFGTENNNENEEEIEKEE